MSLIKIFSFDATKYTSVQMEDEVNNFLQRPEVIAEPENITIHPDEFVIVTIIYKLRKSHTKSISKKSKS